MNDHGLCSLPNRIFPPIKPEVFYQSGGVSGICLLGKGASEAGMDAILSPCTGLQTPAPLRAKQQ